MKLSAELRRLHAHWEAGEFEYLFECGICYALARLRERRNRRNASDAYDDIRKLLQCVQPGFFTLLEPYQATPNKWKRRATMCLLLAHWLEDQGR